MKKTKRTVAKSRYDHSYDTRDRGNTTKDVLDFKSLSGESHGFYKPKDGWNRINIIPFEIKSDNHPLVKSAEMQIGDCDYMLDVWVHKNVGPTGVDCVCLKRNYNKHCPICEEAQKMKEQAKKKEYDELRAKRRAYYNVIDLKDDDQKIQIFSVSHFLFEKELIEAARDDENGGEVISFADISEGRVIKFKVTTESLNGQPMQKYKNFSFEEREEELDDSLIDDAISFDSIITVRDADTLESLMFNGEDVDEEEPAEKKTSKKSADEDESETKDDEPKKKGKSTGCPHGHVYGEDADGFKECVRCKIYNECLEAGQQ